MTKEIYHFFPFDPDEMMKKLGKEKLVSLLQEMLFIRIFETRAESAYLQGEIGGFFHSYAGEEAIQTGCVAAFGRKHWYTTTYRCHALALLLGVDPKTIMAEFYGKKTGNVKGRGGSMHLFADRLLGGLAIVGGHLPIATGAGFTLKYQGKKEEVSICFLGEGAVAQGTFHESLNIASLWDIPCIYVIENNQWGMGTKVNRAIAAKPIAEKFAPAYNMKSFTLDGMDLLSCFAGFASAKKEIYANGRPILIEAITERFRGHSISDPGLYRSKEELESAKKRDPIEQMKKRLFESKMLSEGEFQKIEEKIKQQVRAAEAFAEESPFPDPIGLEEDVLAKKKRKCDTEC
jgi:pyruvate dehydrogenase E1 component alpha subunit